MTTQTKKESSLFDIDFLRTQLALESVDGWFHNIPHGIFDCLLQLQNDKGATGHLGEIGVWYGKSASIMAQYTKDNEDLFLIDPVLSNRETEIKQNISNVCNDNPPQNIITYPIFSENFDPREKEAKYYRKTRFFHIDGCHTAEAIYYDMDIAHDLLAQNGILVIDDFFNITYPQITEAVYQYLAKHPMRFQMFLCGGNKAYLCRTAFFREYYNYCLADLQQDMLKRKIALNIMKTSGIADSKTVSITGFDKNVHGPSGMRGPDHEQNFVECLTKHQHFEKP